MKNLTRIATGAVLCAAMMLPGVSAMAQYHDDHHDDHHDHPYVRHEEWRKGYRMRHEDWERAQRIDDWRARHLSAPPRGYEWREVDGNYVLAAVATGVIASAIVASTMR